jgi:hypothetical protein
LARRGITIILMGFNRRKMEDRRRDAAEKEAASRRATDAQVLEDAERLIAAWNERQAKRMPMLFSPTIGAAIAAGFWFLWVRCPACRTINAIDLRTLDRYRDAAVTSLIPALSCRSCRPNAPFAELVRLSRKSIADEMREEHRRRVEFRAGAVASRAFTVVVGCARSSLFPDDALFCCCLPGVSQGGFSGNSVELNIKEVPDFIGAPGRIRTSDPQIRSLVLSDLITAGDRTWRKIGEIANSRPPAKIKRLILLALPRGLEPLFSP